MFDFWKKKRKQPAIKKKSDTTNTPLREARREPVSKSIPKESVNPKKEAQAADKPKDKNRHVDKARPKDEFIKTFRNLTYRHRPWDIWRDMILMFACTISNSVDKSHYDEREDLYMKTIKKYKKEEQMLFPELFAILVLALEENPEQDFLGSIFMVFELVNNVKIGNHSTKQIFTPYSVCQAMAAITLGNDLSAQVKKEGYITINDPCCGGGSTLIAAIHEARRQLEKNGLNFQNHVLVVAQDIELTVALMCYIQLSLLGVAAYVKVGNTITEPMMSNDTLENYWFSPMYFSEVWSTRRLIKKLSSM